MLVIQLCLRYRLAVARASKDCLVYLEDIVSGLVDITAPLGEGTLYFTDMSSLVLSNICHRH